MGSNQFFCPMIKANGYGHGDVELARALSEIGVRYKGVALVEEGVRLRENKITDPILFFGGFFEEAAADIIHHNLTPVMSTWSQLKSIEQAAQKYAAGKKYPVHLKFDTGMNRLGFDLADSLKLKDYFKQSQLHLEGICTHLHSGEDAGHFFGESFKQLTLFREIEDQFAEFKPYSHTLNSSGLMNFVHHQGQKLPHHINNQQGARPGIAIYGQHSLDQPTVPLKPVMSLRSRIAKYKKVHKGKGVSYGLTWKAPEESIIGVVPMGYADGYHRTLSNKGQVLFRGQLVPVVGTVCMDYFMIDITNVVKNESFDSLGAEEVTLWGLDPFGNQLSVREIAKSAGTISYEMLTSVSSRVPRKYVQENRR